MQLKYLKQQKFSIVLTFMLMLPIWASAQEGNWQSDLDELFEDDRNIEWYGAFNGTKGAFFSFKIYLAYDGQQLKGWYEYEDDSKRYGLDGILEGSVMIMEEHYINNVESGIFRGAFDGNSFVGEWSNYSGSLKWDVYFYEENLPDTKQPNLRNPAFITFTTKEPHLSGRWHIFTDFIQTIHGVFITKNNEIFQIRPLQLPDQLNVNKVFYLYLLSSDMQPGVRFKLDFEARKGEIIEYTESEFNLNSFKSFHEGLLIRKSGFHQFSLRYTLPAMDKKSSRLVIFNDTACVNPSRIPFRQDRRGDVLRTSVFYPTFVSKRYISGLYSISHVTDETLCQEEIPFLWDSRKKKWLNLEEEINDPLEWEIVITKYKNEMLAKIKEDKPVDSPWHDLNEENFKYMLLSDSGVVLAKGYDPVFGVLYLPVDIELINTFFDRRSLVQKAIKSKL